MKVFDGVPAPYDCKKKKVVPEALKVLRMQNHRKFCKLGDLCTKVGWKMQGLIETLEEKRKTRAKNFYQKKLNKTNLKRRAENLPEVKGLRTQLAEYGF